MSVKSKKLVTLLVFLLAILVMADLLGANYLVSFAIGRTTSGGACI